MVNDFKRELSRISGVDFFNPKYRDVFKRYFPDDDKEDELSAEEIRLNEVIGEDNNTKVEAENEQTTANEETEIEEDKTENIDENTGEEPKDNSESVEEENPDTENVENSEPVVESTSTEPNQDLIDAKVELELVKAGVREDRLEPAKRLVEPEVHSLEDLDKVKELIKQFPEWLKDSTVNTKPFGMPVGEGNGDLTEEEKRLKAMGIDPRS